MDEPNVTTEKARLTGAEPQLLVTDFAASVAYYKKLGFEIVFAYGEPPFYAQIQRDGVPINLRWVAKLPSDPAEVEAESILAVTLIANDVKQLYLELLEEGIEFHQPLKTEPWGALTCIAKDPDGNLILFAGSG